MRSIWIISLASICLITKVSLAQDSTKISVGVNISNNLTNYLLHNYDFNGGFCAEPVVQVKLNNYIRARFVLGYSKNSIQKILETNTLENNQLLNYYNQGVYLKGGIFTTFQQKKSLFSDAIGISLSYSNFTQRGDLTIKGKYFGDYINQINAKNQQVLFIEPSLDIMVYEHKYFTLSSNINFPIPIYSSISKDLPNYYIPGYGETIESPFFHPVWYRFEFYLSVPLK